MRALPIPCLVVLAFQLGRAESTAQPGRLSPIGNYHAHLISESSGKLLMAPRLAEVELPAEIDHVIREWERATKAGNPPSIAALFTADGLLSRPAGWVRGTDAIRSAMADESSADLRVVGA